MTRAQAVRLAVVGSAALGAWAATLLLLVARPSPPAPHGPRLTASGRIAVAPSSRPDVTARPARPNAQRAAGARVANDAGHGADPGLLPVRAPMILALARRWLLRLTAREKAASLTPHDAVPFRLEARITDLRAYRLPRGFAVDFTLHWPREDELGQLTIVVTRTGARVTGFELGATLAD